MCICVYLYGKKHSKTPVFVYKFKSLLGKIIKTMYMMLQLNTKLRKFQNIQENIETLLSALQS